MKSLAVALLLLAPVAASAQSFEKPLGMPGIGQPIGSSDVNGDGKPDLVSRAGTDLLVYLADGTGHLRPPIRSTVGAYFSDAVWNDEPSAALGDFNGDGRIDAAAALMNGIAIMTGDGAGHFTQASVVADQGGSTSVVARDMNNDGKLDLVILTDGHEYIEVYLGDGAGHFSRTASVFVDHADRIVTGDFNGDGNADVLVHISGIGGRLFPGDGAGGFGPKQDNPRIGMWSGAVADFNEDGIPDLLYTGDGGIRVAFGQAGSPFAASTGIDFSASPDVDLLTSLQSSAAGNLNGDGHQDVVLLEYDGTAWVALGDGHGRFSVPVRFAAPYPNGSAAWSVTVADENADGYGDVVAGMLWGCTAETGCWDGYTLLYTPTTADRARATETIVKAVDGTMGSLANLLASTAVSLDRLSAADFSTLATLDAPISSRASQTSVNALSAQVGALGAALVTQPAASALQSAIADVGTTTRTSIAAASDAATRIAIERALGDGVSVIWFMLPASQNGQLDTVRQIVTESIAGLQAIGIHIAKAASTAFAKAEAAFASGEYVKAYNQYAQVYQALR